MPSAQLVLSRLGLGIAGAVGLYAVLIGTLLRPNIQKFALYAHKFNTLYLKDLNDPEAFGFAPNQVTPFVLQTPDNESIYAWHVLATDVYTQHEKQIRAEDRSESPVPDITKTLGFKLLTSNDPTPPRVVIYFHGNAGHLAENWRPDTYRYLATQPNTHVFAVDYRGFGHSTGSPTEAGVVIDATTIVSWVLNVANIPSERVVLAGQSLGTAVTSAVALHFADPSNELTPALARELQPLYPGVSVKSTGFQPTTFAGIVIAAPFSSIPALLLTYRIGGLIPLLLPLRPFPSFAGTLTARMQDKWLSAERWNAYYGAVAASPQLQRTETRSLGSLQVLHALNDMDIPYHQTEMICRRMLGERNASSEVDSKEIDATQCVDGAEGPALVEVRRSGWPYLRFEILRFGGHNRVITYSAVHNAVSRALNDFFD